MRLPHHEKAQSWKSQEETVGSFLAPGSPLPRDPLRQWSLLSLTFELASSSQPKTPQPTWFSNLQLSLYHHHPTPAVQCLISPVSSTSKADRVQSHLSLLCPIYLKWPVTPSSHGKSTLPIVLLLFSTLPDNLQVTTWMLF